MKNVILLLAAAAALSMGASATTITSGGTAVAGQGVFSSVPGAMTVDFEAGLPANYTGGEIVSGNVSGQWAAPTDDATQYLGTSVGSVTIDLSGMPASYFGMYLGSVDSYNSVTLFNGDASETFTGTDLAAVAGIPNSGNTSAYFNFSADAGQVYTSIVLTSTQQNMESDNHAFVNATPEPSTALMMGGGALILGFAFRRKLVS